MSDVIQPEDIDGSHLSGRRKVSKLVVSLPAFEGLTGSLLSRDRLAHTVEVLGDDGHQVVSS